jgi:hypothetical protein
MMSNFIPEQPQISSKQIPFFDDVKEVDGWAGMTTGKSVEKLKEEIETAIKHLGGMVTSFLKGTYPADKYRRDGYQIFYFMKNDDGKILEGRIDIAALPCRNDYRKRESYDKRREKSIKMALFMTRDTINALWRFAYLSPGFAPLMPFLFGDGNKTITELWGEHSKISDLLLTKGEEFVEGEYKELR